MSVRRRFPEILLAGSIAILFYPLLTGKVLFWGVPSLQFYPWRKMAFDLLRQGQFPVWNSLMGNGAPLLANYQTAVFYPPNWLDFILPTEYTMGWLGMLHLLWAGLGMMAYLRRLGVSRFGQAVGGLAFGLNSYLVTRFGFLSITFAVPWLPWLLWAIEGLWQSDPHAKWRPLAILGGVVGLQLLAGHAQTTAYSLELAAAYSLWRGLQRKQGRYLLRTLAGIGLGASIAAIQLLPTLELMLTSQRSAGVDFDFAMNYSYWPWHLLTWILPDLFGNPMTGDYWGYGVYWEGATFVGLICFVLAFRAGILWIRKRRQPSTEHVPALDVVPFFVLTLPVVLIFALGKNTPIFVWLFRNVPTFDLFQAPARWMLLAVFSVTVLGGIGAQHWRLSERGTYWTRLAVAAGLSMLATAIYARVQLGGMIEPSFTRAFARLSISIALFAIIVLLMPAPRTSRRELWQATILSLIALDLVTAHWGFNSAIDPAFYRHSPALAQDIAQAAPDTRTFYLPDDEQAAKFTFFNLDDFGSSTLEAWLPYRESLLPNIGMLDGPPSANNFDPLLIGPYDQFMHSLEGVSPQEALPRLRAMNVGTLLVMNQPYELDLIARSARVSAYRVPDPLPRAYLVASAIQVTDTQAAIAALSAPDYDPAQVVFVEQGNAPQFLPLPETPSGEASPGNASVLRETPRAITIAIQASQSAWLVLSDSWYPGWQAELDGDAIPIYRANAAFRAVNVPAGQHTLVFEYHPRSLMWGALVSAAAITIGVSLSVGSFASRWTKSERTKIPPG